MADAEHRGALSPADAPAGPVEADRTYDLHRQPLSNYSPSVERQTPEHNKVRPLPWPRPFARQTANSFAGLTVTRSTQVSNEAASYRLPAKQPPGTLP